MDPTARRGELKAFLRARRAAVLPEAVGLARGRRRLTPGLRREELASLAGVGLTWYTWLEQGRDITVSRDMLARVASALQLSPSDRVYLFALAGVTVEEAPCGASVGEPLRRAVAGYTAGPALIVAENFDVLAHNELAEAVYLLSALTGRFANNHLWRLFMDPERRRLYRRLDDDSSLGPRGLVGIFRLHYARHVGEPAFEDVLGDLLAHSPAFVRLWAYRETRALADPPHVPIDHPALGRLEFESVRFTPADAPATTLHLLAPVDEATAAAMTRARRAHGRRANAGSGHRRRNPARRPR